MGPDVDREEADRILRDSMADLGTPVVRRWLMWAGVMLATAWTDLRPRWRWRPLVAGGLGAIAVLGAVATADLFDAGNGGLLPWMGERPWWAELLLGGAGAVIVPLVISVLWGRRWRVAAIAGVALALLLHVTVAVVAVYGTYAAVEWLVSRPVEGSGPSVPGNRADPEAGRDPEETP